MISIPWQSYVLMGSVYAALLFWLPHAIAWRVAATYRRDLSVFHKRFRVLTPLRIGICALCMTLFVGVAALNLSGLLIFCLVSSPIFMLGVLDYMKILDIYEGD